MRFSNMLRATAGAALLLSLGACDDGATNDEDRIPAPFTPRSDVELIDALVPHHESAIEMAEQIVERGDDPELVDMANMMITAQRSEIETMGDVREALTGERRASDDAMRDDHAADDVAQLRGLDGDELERRFLQDMIPHHAGALQLAHRALPNLDSAELAMLAEMTVMDQAREIGEMHAMLMERTSPSP